MPASFGATHDIFSKMNMTSIMIIDLLLIFWNPAFLKMPNEEVLIYWKLLDFQFQNWRSMFQKHVSVSNNLYIFIFIFKNWRCEDEGFGGFGKNNLQELCMNLHRYTDMTTKKTCKTNTMRRKNSIIFGNLFNMI